MPVISLSAQRRLHSASKEGAELLPFPAAPRATIESVNTSTLRFQQRFDLAKCLAEISIVIRR